MIETNNINYPKYGFPFIVLCEDKKINDNKKKREFQSSNIVSIIDILNTPNDDSINSEKSLSNNKIKYNTYNLDKEINELKFRKNTKIININKNNITKRSSNKKNSIKRSSNKKNINKENINKKSSNKKSSIKRSSNKKNSIKKSSNKKSSNKKVISNDKKSNIKRSSNKKVIKDDNKSNKKVIIDDDKSKDKKSNIKTARQYNDEIFYDIDEIDINLINNDYEPIDE